MKEELSLLFSMHNLSSMRISHVQRFAGLRAISKTWTGSQKGASEGASLQEANGECVAGDQKELNDTLVEMFQDPLTDGGWLTVAEKVAKAFSETREPSVVTEYAQLMSMTGKSSLAGPLKGLVQLRNEIHESYFVDDTSPGEWLGRAEPLWNKILLKGSPLFRYQLAFVENLLDFGEFDLDKHKYQVRWLMGEYFVPRAEIVEWPAKLRKGRLFLKHPDREGFLPLYPFMLYEYCQITKAREASCIDKMSQDTISFATFRFPYKWNDRSFLKDVTNLFSKTPKGG